MNPVRWLARLLDAAEDLFDYGGGLDRELAALATPEGKDAGRRAGGLEGRREGRVSRITAHDREPRRTASKAGGGPPSAPSGPAPRAARHPALDKGEDMESMINARAGRCTHGSVTTRWQGAPVADGVDTGMAALVAVEIGGEVKREWPSGILVECPLGLASALDDLLDAAPDLDLAAAVLEELDRQYEPCLDGLDDEAPEGSFFRSAP